MIDPGSAAADYLRQAGETLEEARILLEEEHSAGTINRSYYAAFYAACALLDSMGLKARSHQSVISLLHREFVRSGRLDRDLMRDSTRLFEARMSGDYGPFSTATLERAKEAHETAVRFLAMAKIVL